MLECWSKDWLCLSPICSRRLSWSNGREARLRLDELTCDYRLPMITMFPEEAPECSDPGCRCRLCRLSEVVMPSTRGMSGALPVYSSSSSVWSASPSSDSSQTYDLTRSGASTWISGISSVFLEGELDGSYGTDCLYSDVAALLIS